MRTWIKGLAGLLALVFLASLQGCGMQDARVHAEAGVAAFHKSLDAGDMDGIWKGADEAFRAAITRQEFERFVGAVHRKLGNVVSTTTAGWSVNSRNLKTFVVLQQQTQFERGKGNETFTFAVANDRAALVGYNVQSMDLITL